MKSLRTYFFLNTLFSFALATQMMVVGEVFSESW